MCVDEHYLRQLAVTLASLSGTADGACRVHVLHEGVQPADRDRVGQSIGEHVEIRWLDAADAVRGHRLPRTAPRSMYLRLFVSELLPELDRVLYLDADLVVRRPLTPLWESELAGRPVGAVRDAFMPWVVRNPAIDWRELGVEPDAAFYNSGVMLVSLPDWRAQDVGRRSAALLSESSPMLDQCALNVVLAGNWASLHPAWNLQSYHLMGDRCLALAAEGRRRVDDALADPAIVHFTGGSFNRPWQAPCGNPYRDEWLGWLDRTPWRGWRPRPVPAVRRAMGRTRRAMRVLRHGGADGRPPHDR